MYIVRFLEVPQKKSTAVSFTACGFSFFKMYRLSTVIPFSLPLNSVFRYNDRQIHSFELLLTKFVK